MAHILFNNILCNLFITVTFLKLSVAVDTLFPNQTIGIGQTLVSRSQLFELGFFTPGTSRNRFFGIWYKNTPDVVVWVANRNNPIDDSQGVLFAITGNGSLAIRRGGSNIWSANSSGVASNPVLQLLDTGNLVLADMMMEGSSQSYIWQSFDYPTDTLLPGMKIVDDTDAGVETYLTSWRNPDDPSPGDFVFRIENLGLPEVVILGGKMKRYRTGKWNGLYLSGLPRFPNAIFKPELDFKGERLVSVSRPYDSSIFTRGTLDTSGSFQRYTMNAGKDNWNYVHSFPGDQCDKYGYCGPNGICRIDKPQKCECFKGFAPKSQKDWDLQGWSGGCTRTTPSNCQSEEGFLEVRGVKYPDMLKFWLNTSISLAECRAECLKNCSCTAYANPYITNGGSGCVMWLGDLMDTRELAAADSKQNIYIRLPVSELVRCTTLFPCGGCRATTITLVGFILVHSNTNLGTEKKSKRRPTKLILIVTASGIFVSVFITGGIFIMTRRKRQAPKINNEDLELPLFKLVTVIAATNNFSRENMIGEGGFGPVYKGNLFPGEEVAVKRLSRTSGQGLEEFKNEVILIAKLQHKNLVRILGCCIEGEERMLIYEYMQNKSLDFFVFDLNRRKLLTWPKRFDIIMGIARGLLYLHHDSRLKIIHRDLKTSNILLDGNLNPKISDFGLARIFEEDQPIVRTRRVAGTYGYMAPEYAVGGKFSVKSDIFSLGVVLLEIVSGKKNRGFDHHSLLGQAWLLWKENRILELMDDCLSDSFIEAQVKRCIQVGLLCVQKFAKDRPVMPSVLLMLGTDGAILPEPKEPGLFVERSSSSVSRSAFRYTKSEKVTITITDLEAR